MDVARPRKILVVDDEDRNLRLMEALLAPLGHTVILAVDGRDALQKVNADEPDLILLDVNMPGMDGFEVARRLKADPQTSVIPIVMVTALKDVADRVKALEAGADDFLNKPVDKTELRARVEDLQRQRDEQRRRFETLEAASRRREHELNHALGEMRESGERLRGDLAVAREQLDGTLRELEAHRSELASARAELEMWRGWREAFDRKLPVRIYHALRRLLRR